MCHVELRQRRVLHLEDRRAHAVMRGAAEQVALPLGRPSRRRWRESAATEPVVIARLLRLRRLCGFHLTLRSQCSRRDGMADDLCARHHDDRDERAKKARGRSALAKPTRRSAQSKPLEAVGGGGRHVTEGLGHGGGLTGRRAPSVRRMPRRVALTASALVGGSWPARLWAYRIAASPPLATRLPVTQLARNHRDGRCDAMSSNGTVAEFRSCVSGG